MHSPDRKPSALGYALLTYMTLVIAAITLIPFEFKIPERIHISLTGSVSDILENIVLFIPLGFLFQLARRRPGGGSLLQALGFGVLVSTAVEACQLFLPGRDSSVIDVATNGLGALLGAAAAAYLRARERQEPVPLLFAFEMPLMNVVYLLIPLLVARQPFHGRGTRPAGADDGAGRVRRQRDRLRVREPHRAQPEAGRTHAGHLCVWHGF